MRLSTEAACIWEHKVCAPALDLQEFGSSMNWEAASELLGGCEASSDVPAWTIGPGFDSNCAAWAVVKKWDIFSDVASVIKELE